MSRTDFFCLGLGVAVQGYAMLPYEWVNEWSALLGMGLVLPPILNALIKERSDDA